ncbi:MAG: hypothetical protein ACI9K1_000539 [Arcticibacterium sp.]
MLKRIGKRFYEKYNKLPNTVYSKKIPAII